GRDPARSACAGHLHSAERTEARDLQHDDSRDACGRCVRGNPRFAGRRSRRNADCKLVLTVNPDLIHQAMMRNRKLLLSLIALTVVVAAVALALGQRKVPTQPKEKAAASSPA